MSETPHKGSLLVIFLTVFIDLLGFGMVLPLLPIYADQFAEDPHGLRLGLLMAVFSIMQFLFAPIWGRFSDHVGRRPVLMVGLVGSVVFYTLFGVGTALKSLTLLFVSRVGAGIAGATIPTAQAYIADSTSLEQRPHGMALIGIAFGLGFTFGPLLAFLAVPSGHGDPGPWPGYASAILSGVALLLAVFWLPESLRPDSTSAERRWVDLAGLRAVLTTPSIGLLLISIFISIFSFANFETTLSMLIKGSHKLNYQVFHFDWQQVCLTYAYIGATMVVIQGGFVRRLARRRSEGIMAGAGALIDAAGFGLVAVAAVVRSTSLLFVGLTVVVFGSAFLQPSLNSLLSRRSDPAKQGAILGVGQSVNALARILGAGLGIPLLTLDVTVPYHVSAGLMVLGVVLIVAAARGGRDYGVGTVAP